MSGGAESEVLPRHGPVNPSFMFLQTPACPVDTCPAVGQFEFHNSKPGGKFPNRSSIFSSLLREPMSRAASAV